jgi:uncharacterized protein
LSPVPSKEAGGETDAADSTLFPDALVDTLMELFSIPYGEKIILYAPLKQVAFLGNRELASLVAGLGPGREPDASSLRVSEAVAFIRRTGILDPDPTVPELEGAFRYEPVCATLFLTNRCNLRCVYCYADAGTEEPLGIPFGLARQAIDLVCDHAARRGLSSFEMGFHGGGEPTLQWETLEASVDHARSKSLRAVVSASTNGCWSSEQRAYLLDRFDGLSLSFDGPEEIQDRQRPLNRRASVLLHGDEEHCGDGPTVFSLRHPDDREPPFSRDARKVRRLPGREYRCETRPG